MRPSSEARRLSKRGATGFHLTFLVWSLWRCGTAVGRSYFRLRLSVRNHRKFARPSWRSIGRSRSGSMCARHHPLISTVQSSKALCFDTQRRLTTHRNVRWGETPSSRNCRRRRRERSEHLGAQEDAHSVRLAALVMVLDGVLLHHATAKPFCQVNSVSAKLVPLLVHGKFKVRPLLKP